MVKSGFIRFSVVMGSLHEVLCGVAVAAGALCEDVCDAVRFHTPEIQRWVRNHTLLVSILVTSGLGAGVPLVLVASSGALNKAPIASSVSPSVSPSADNIKTDELVLGASLRDIQVQIDRALGETLSPSSLSSTSTSLSSTSSSSPLPDGLAVGKR